MYEEFGIELPVTTNWLLGSARIVRSFGGLVAIMLGVSLLIAIAWLLVPGAIISRIPFLKNSLNNKRQVMAELAFHAAQLRSIGVSANQAFAAANFAAGLSSTKTEAVVDEDTAIRTPGYELLQFALQQPANYANDRMLMEVADCYRRRIVTVSDWWIHWLVYAMQCFVMLCVLFMVVSIFMPLISIVGGLT